MVLIRDQGKGLNSKPRKHHWPTIPLHGTSNNNQNTWGNSELEAFSEIICLFFVLFHFLFKTTFRAVLDLQKNWGMFRGFLHVPLSTHIHSLPHYQLPPSKWHVCYIHVMCLKSTSQCTEVPVQSQWPDTTRTRSKVPGSQSCILPG
jgi:hypothetical protein